MPKQQSSLDSFFGVQKNKVKKQKTLNGFFASSSSSTAAKAKAATKDKENTDNEEDDESNDNDNKKVVAVDAAATKVKSEEVDDDDDDDENKAAASTPTATAATSKKRESPSGKAKDKNGDGDDGDQKKKAKRHHRPAILDDDDSDGDNVNDEVGSEEKPAAVKTTPMTTTTKKTETTKALKKTQPPIKQETNSSKPSTTATIKSRSTTKPVSNAVAVAASSRVTGAAAATATSTDDTPERRKLVQRAKKIAKAYKVEPDISDTTKDASLALTSPVQYQDLVQVLEGIEAITKRLEIQALLTKFLRRVVHYSPQDVYAVVYLASNSVAPAYDCVELGIGDSLLIKAISEAYGSNIATVKALYKTEGDLGSVAQSCKSKQRTLAFGLCKPKPLTSKQVLQVFRDIAGISGTQSQKLKVDKIKKLLVAVQHPAETKYIIRGLQGKLRIGLAESTVLISLAHALAMTIPATVAVGTGEGGITSEEEHDDDEEKVKDNDPIVTAILDESLPVEKTLEAASNMIRKVHSEVPSLDALLDASLRVPIHQLHLACHFHPGIPVVPMLAKPTKSIQEVLKRLEGQEFTCEFKYDGERAQIHKTKDGTLKVFSRNLLETSGKYPEVPRFVQEAAAAAAAAAKALQQKADGVGGDDDDGEDAKAAAKHDIVVESFVLDAEVVAFNQQTGQLVPFQVLSTRKKELESNETAKVQIIVQAFDLMYLNGQSLLATPLRERRRLLKMYFAPVPNKFQFAIALDFLEKDDGDTAELEEFLDTAVKGQCEGLMVKTMDDVYEPSRRSLNWLKLKKDYLEGLGDSLDLVVLGAYYGRGKRTGVYGAYLLACYDEESEEFQSVCKIGTGFSDEDLQTLSAHLNEHKLEGGKSSQYVVADGLECDVWFDAVQVWEVKAADLSKSSLHRGAFGKLEEGRGIGLRFPRFERIREDKAPEQATNSDQVLEMYYNQDTVKGQQQGYGDDDDDEDGGI